MNDNQPLAFTCKTCSGHKLTVTRVWKILAGPDSESWQEWGPLEVDHRWRFEFKEKIEKEIKLRSQVAGVRFSLPSNYETGAVQALVG